ncbi:MAG: prephenate dehydrogenase/arogenate dehydrogenase family protein [Bdellovibrionales bacterium]|nr:prephenate dehydrogenase/arogenate dehydrogenase family protein [Bdellovibrionales bacterium]
MTQTEIAYLGPEGTYTERALKEHFPSVRRKAYQTIADVVEAVADGSAAAGFVPFENVLQGPVVETLDHLLAHKDSIRITNSVFLTISHALGAPEGANLGGLTRIYSHTQALRQCSQFLRTSAPQASSEAVSSTALAAKMVADSADLSCGAIAPKETLQLAGLNVLSEDIGDSKQNKTRFVLLKRAGEAEDILAGSGPWSTTIAIEPGRDRQGLLYDLLGIISKRFDVNLLSIHSRPDTRGGFVFFIDLEGRVGTPALDDCLEALDEYCTTETGKTAGVSVLGSYIREPFYTRSIRSIGIIGGLGLMGQWFGKLFSELGLAVRISDTAGGEPLEALCAECDVLLLSVPMASAKQVIDQVAPLVRPGQLIAENCSIKNSSLPHMIQALPEGCEVLGVHTMFGPQTEDLRGQNVVITSTERSGTKAQELEDLFYKYGANILHADIAHHDKVSAYIQSLYHLVLIGLAEVMRSEFTSAEDLEKFSTPNARALFEPMKRIVRQRDELIRDLQTLNDQAPQTRQLFLDTFSELVKALDDHDIDRLLTSARRSEEFLS